MSTGPEASRSITSTSDASPSSPAPDPVDWSLTKSSRLPDRSSAGCSTCGLGKSRLLGRPDGVDPFQPVAPNTTFACPAEAFVAVIGVGLPTAVLVVAGASAKTLPTILLGMAAVL